MAQRKKRSLGFGVYRMYSERERDQYIGAMVDEWKKKQGKRDSVESPFITISRQFGCMALETGLRFTERLNRADASETAWTFYDREIVHRIASDMKISQRLSEVLTEGSRSRISRYVEGLLSEWPIEDEVFQRTVHVIRSLCEKGHTVVVGRGACKIAEDMPQGFHIRIVAPPLWRVEQVSAFYDIPEEEATRRVRLMDAEREAFFRKYLNEDVSNPDLYDLVLNQATLSTDSIVDIVVLGMKSKGLIRSGPEAGRKEPGAVKVA
jgi:cytidylate kinase